MIMEVDEDTQNYIKLAQFNSALNTNFDISMREEDLSRKLGIEKTLQCMNDINYAIPSKSLVEFHIPDLLGYTPLHFVAISNDEFYLNYLLNKGADFTAKNYNGYTPLRLAIESNQNCLNLTSKLSSSFIDRLLSAHVDTNNTSNPKCKNGLSHFHIACMVNNTKAVEFFLKSGVSVNETVHTDFIRLPGYTPLHFAARYCSIEIAKILLKYNADVNLKDAAGMTPLHLIIEQNIKIINKLKIRQLTTLSHLDPKCEFVLNESLIDLLVKKYSTDIANFIDDIGLTHFHVVCTKQDKSFAENLLNQGVDIDSFINSDSPIWPGYTALHFAAHFNIQTVKLLLDKGAYIAAKDVNGVTPFDLCLERYSPEDIHSILSRTVLKDIRFSNHTKLTDAVLTMRKCDVFAEFLDRLSDVNIFISLDSLLWPGYTLLHLIVVFAKTESQNYIMPSDTLNFRNGYEDFISSFLARGGDIAIQETNGFTPLHLALKLKKGKIVNYILHNHKNKFTNLVEQEKVGHFHIACASGNKSLVEEFLLAGVNINSPARFGFEWYRQSEDNMIFVNAGSTPLHVSVAFQRMNIVKLLLHNGADPFIKDADGLTSIHLAFVTDSTYDNLTEIFSTIPMEKFDNSMTDGGLSHFHIACYANHYQAVHALLKRGVDVNASIKCGLKDTYAENPEALKSVDYYTCEYDCSDRFLFLSPFAGYAPLHFAAKHKDPSVFELLIKHGADVHVKNALGLTPLHILIDLAECGRSICNFIWNKVDSNNFKKWIDNEGFTSLHIACARLEKDAVENLLKSGEDVNAQIDLRSPTWAGDTPLHVLIKQNVFLDDEENFNPIALLLLKHGADVNIKNIDGLTPVHVAYGLRNKTYGDAFSCVPDLLLQSREAFNANPIDKEGLSHFHIACTRNNPDFVQKFLKHGLDVNQSTDHFAPDKGGFAPLHFAAEHGCPKVLDVLLRHGAYVNAEDSYGCTPLQVAVRRDETTSEIIETFSRFGNIDINIVNIYGVSVLELCLADPARARKFQTLLKHAPRVNIIGSLFMEGLIATALGASDFVFDAVLDNAVDLNSLDFNGFNAIHNIVSCKHMSRGAIAYAKAIEKLEKIGCELDCQDNEGRTPFHVALMRDNPTAVSALLMLDADVNIVDRNHMSPIHYLVEGNYGRMSDALQSFAEYTRKAIFLGLDVTELTKLLPYFQAQGIVLREILNDHELSAELDNMKNIKVDEYFTLRDFLTKTAIKKYVMMSYARRQVINEIIEAIMDSKDFPHFVDLLKQQHRKALARLTLFEPAKSSLQLFTRLPHLCCEAILMHLNRRDLKNLMALRTKGLYFPK